MILDSNSQSQSTLSLGGLQVVVRFVYLETLIAMDGSSTEEIKRRIKIEKLALS